MCVISLLSLFINNTAAVAVFIPVVIEVSRRTSASPSRLLMPMSHAATFGGMCTLIGTSTNLVSHEFALSQGLRGFSMFELGKVGLPMLVAGFAYILLVGRRFLPDRRSGEEPALERAEHYLAELIINVNSQWVDRPINAESFERDYDLELVSVIRQGQPVSLSNGGACFAASDAILVRGRLEQVLEVAEEQGLEIHRPSGLGASTKESANESELTKQEKLPLAEVVVLTTSGLIGRTLKSARFAETYNVTVLALRRRGHLSERHRAFLFTPATCWSWRENRTCLRC